MKVFFGKIINIFTQCVVVVLQEGDNKVISKIREIFRNTSISAATQFLNLGINLIIVILLARWLGALVLGQYALAVSISGIVFGIVNFGLQGILTREVAKNKENASVYLSNALGIRLLISIPIGIMLSYVVALGLGFSIETLRLIFLGSVFVGVSSIITLFYAIFQATHKFEDQFILSALYKITSLIGCYVLLENDYGLDSIFILFAALQSIIAILAAVKTSKTICAVRLSVDAGFWRVFIRESFPLSLAGTAEFINLKSDAIILGTIQGEADTGIYNGAYNLYLGAITPLYAFIVAFYPTFSRTYAESKKQAAQLFKNTFLLAAIGSIILALILVLFSGEIVLLVYGDEFLAAVTPFMILAAGLPFIVLNRLNNYALIGMGLQKWIFYIIASGALFNVVTNLFMIPVYSYIGASITTVITEGLVFIVGFWKIHRKLQC